MQPRRQQQQSILSFLHKQPPRRDPDSAGNGATPEKPPPPPTGSIAGIMERLVRPPQPSGRSQDASQGRHVEGQTLPFRNQNPSNGQPNVMPSGLCNGDYNRVNLFSEQDSATASFHGPQANKLRSSKDEFVKASILFPEPSSNHTPLQEHPKKLLSESPNKQCIRASSLFEEFDVQTPSQNPSKRIFLGLSHGDDTPLTECGSEQTLLQHSSKKFSLNSVNGGYTRAATTFGLHSNGTPTEQPSKKLRSGSSDPLYIKPTNLFAELDANRTPSQNHSTKHIGAATATFPEFDSSPLKPETPAMRAAIPHLKQVGEEQRATADNQCLPLWGLNKIKPAHPLEKKFHVEMAESARSKFEWLNPSNIKDASKRHPNDPLYDKSTLFIPPDALRKMSTSQKQYWNIKSRYMDVVLFFKVGKFYELYELDAEIGQKELDWKMTVSGVGKCRQVGISESGIDDAVDKLVARGYKVGRIEQMESADQAKARGSKNSVIERKLVSVSTPSTAAESNIGPDAVHLLALKELTIASNGCRVFGFAFLDYAALNIWVGSLHDDSSAALGALLVQISPREVIYETSGLSKETHASLRKYASAGSVKMQLTPLATIDFSDASQIRMLIHSKGYFKASKDSWLCALDASVNQHAAICALGGLIGHLSRLMLDDALINGEILPYHVYQTCLRMDGQTLVNLEIFRNSFDGGRSGTLYKHLNHCITAFGKRLLRSWICHPLKDVNAINMRLDIVEGFTQENGLNSITLESLRKIPDLERLFGQVRSTVGLSSTARLPFVGDNILKRRIKTFCTLIKGLKVGIKLLNDLRRGDHGISALSNVVEIPTLSSLYEVINTFEEAIDKEFPKDQGRPVKDDDHSTLIVLVELFIGKASEWTLVINALSTVDVLRSFAAVKVSSFGTMCRPHILVKDNVPILRMKGLWHPYAFAESTNELVPNNLSLGQDLCGLNRFALLLTGPNMGGKSTIMRATCLTAILAQIGSFAPCHSCELTLADSIFTRLGATDQIMSGARFLSNVLRLLPFFRRQLRILFVLLDELGRGTSTFAGYAIAYAVLRHLVERVRCRLLFATHYHPLTKEFASHPHVSLQHMAEMFKPKSSDRGDSDEKELTFLYRLTSGACPESYGLQVATMAGLPKSIVETASVAREMMRSKIARNFKSSEERAEFSTLHEEWLRTAIYVCGVEGQLDDDAMDTAFCISQELKSHFRKAR